MKRFLLVVSIGILFSGNGWSQNVKDKAIATTVSVQKSPAQITISWPTLADASDIKVLRRNKGGSTWATLTTLAPTATSYADQTVSVGTEYEYQIYKTPTSGKPSSIAYISSGIEVPEVEYRGKALLLIDNTFQTSLASKIKELIWDLKGDGWKVGTLYVGPSETAKGVKRKILQEYATDPSDFEAIYVLGHVPVPYSGNQAPDAHPNHVGAWPADVYYADLDTTWWTDQYVNNTSASRSANDNIPGDGKFDNDDIPPNFKVEWQIGRVDMDNMPLFPKSETQLLSQYLDKAHDYKHKVFNVQRRGLIDNNFGWMGGEAFAASGYRNFYSMVGGNNVFEKDYFTTLDTDDYLLSYGCGGGTYTSCSGVGVSADFDTTDVKTVFTVLFGSYFGDWDSQNNFLRAPLASAGYALTSCWSGRPYWIMHHMGMGETVGFTARLTQSNFTEYNTNTSAGVAGTYIGLMGDPTLRLHTVAPASNLSTTAINQNTQVSLTWSASSEAVQGYNVYRLNPATDIYEKANTSLITSLSYTDLTPQPSKNYYMVRAVKLETGSGTYFNQSQGIFDSVQTWVGIEPDMLAGNYKLYPNPADNDFTLEFDLRTDQANSSIIVITDAIGREVYLESLSSLSIGSNRINVNIENLAKGVYNVNLFIDSKQAHVERLVVLK